MEQILAGRKTGYPLTDQGIEQAEKIADFLKPFNISTIYSSPIERAEQTTSIVAKKLGLDYSIDERLTEIDMGPLSGMTFNDMFARHGNIFLKFYEGHPVIEENGIEPFSSIKKRVLDLVGYCSERYHDEDILFVTHMDPIKSMLSTVMQLKPESLYELIIRNASLTMFKKEKSGLSIISINSMYPERYQKE